jgi:hypothetical protein
MTRFLRMLPAAGVLVGFLSGAAQGRRAIAAQEYLASGMYGLALETLRRTVLRDVTAALTVALLVFVALRGVRRAGRSAIRRALIALLPTLGLIVLEVAAKTRATEGRWNLVLITIDTLRPDHLGAYGYPRDTSPQIDDLARRTAVFADASAQWPKTTPSMASMLTGTDPQTNGITRFTPLRMPPQLLFLAEILKEHGYHTAGVSTHPGLSPLHGFHHGFETFFDAWRKGRRKSRVATARALNLLEELAGRGRFFLWVHSMDPHARYEAPQPYHEMFVGDARFDGSRRVRLNPGRNDDIGGVPGRSRLGDEDRLDYYVAEYDAEIRAVDEQSGACSSVCARRARDERDRRIMRGTANELYDLDRDPGETRNRIAEEPEIAARLIAAFERHPATRDSRPAAAALPPSDHRALEELRSLGYLGSESDHR